MEMKRVSGSKLNFESGETKINLVNCAVIKMNVNINTSSIHEGIPFFWMNRTVGG